MELRQIKANTSVVEAMELIPLYKLDESRCILLDTGLLEEREELEQTLLEHGLRPVGILCSHAHVDHCANSGYFQKKYGTKVALTAPEAGICSNILTLKCYFLTLPPDMVARESSCMVHTPDVLVPTEDGPFSFCGADFRIVYTPGHSAGHICTITPDGVCYTADALLSHEMLKAKLPYALSHQMAKESREKLRDLKCSHYIMAHRGVCSPQEINSLIDENQALLRRRSGEILSLISRPMTASQINEAVCIQDELFTKKPRRALRFERNIRFFVEYLTDHGLLETICKNGVVYYRQPESPRQ